MSHKTIKVKLDHTPHESISDGAGNMLRHGEVVSTPAEIADVFVAKGFAVLVDGSSSIQARKDFEAAEAKRRTDLSRAGASARMAVWDALPPDVRAMANEEGDHVVEAYLASLPSMPLDDYEAATGDPFTDAADASQKHLTEVIDPPPQKRRGRPPKPTPPEGGDPQ